MLEMKSSRSRGQHALAELEELKEPEAKVAKAVPGYRTPQKDYRTAKNEKPYGLCGFCDEIVRNCSSHH